ncbi:MAG: glycosyltransferase family 2 protein [Anaerolineales bacterium]
MATDSHPLVSIVVVNWNGREVLPLCLEALTAQVYNNYEIIVVDNGSSDHSADELDSRWPEVKTVRLGENKGFAVANNIGARLARGTWLALVNNDAFPEPNWLIELIAAAQKYPNFSFFGSRLVQYDDPRLLDGTGDVFHISGLAWRRHYNHPVSSVNHKVEEVFGPCAAAAMYSREAFWQVGGLEEDFFSYHEDVDLAFRLRLQGYRCLYIPNAVVRHVGSASSGKRSDLSVYYGHRNLVWSYVQNMPSNLFWKYLPAHLLANLVFLIYYSVRGQPGAIWRAKLDALMGLPIALRKRRAIQSRCEVPISDIVSVIERGWVKPYFQEFVSRR